MMSAMQKKQAGFTLIELLVVISIIGVLSSVVLAALNTARAKGRDAALIGAAQELQKAVELYYHDNGVYPPHTPTTPCGSPAPGLCYTVIEGATTDSVFKNALVPAYMSALPDIKRDFSNGDKGVTTSRLLYRRITNSAAIPGAGCTAAAKNCYAILFYTETDTNLSTANTGTLFLSNETIVKPYSDNMWRY